MKGIKLKIILILLMLVPIPFSCTDKNADADLNVEPYYDIVEMDFSHIDKYYITKEETLMFDLFNQDFDNNVYPCDSIAIYVKATLLRYHSQYIPQFRGFFTQEAYASCDPKRNGCAGTLERVDKIYVSSNYDFDETHGKNYDLSDIIDIFAYNANDPDSWKSLKEYNETSPHEAPKRFYLMIKRKPTLSSTQQFVIKYYMIAEDGKQPEYYIITTPVLHVR